MNNVIMIPEKNNNCVVLVPDKDKVIFTHVKQNGNNIYLPIASKEHLGVVQIDNGLDITPEGLLSVDYEAPELQVLIDEKILEHNFNESAHPYIFNIANNALILSNQNSNQINILNNDKLDKNFNILTTRVFLQLEDLIALRSNDETYKVTLNTLRAYLVQGLVGLSFQIVEELPPTGIGNIIYLVAINPEELSEGYYEYIWLEDLEKFELLGSTIIDLSEYAKIVWVNETFINKDKIISSFQDIPDDNHLASEKLVKDSLDNKIDKTDIVDNLTTNDATKPLSAKQGKNLQDNKIDKTDIVDNLTTDNATKVLSAKQGIVVDNMLSQIKRLRLLKQGTTNETSYNSFITKTWTGLTTIYPQYLWTDGTNIYHSIGTTQHILNVSTSTWTTKTWNGLSDFTGSNIWTDGVNIYYSDESYPAIHRVLDTATSTWITKTWNGFTDFSGRNIWTDGTNIYHSIGTTQHILNVSTSTWTTKTWNGLISFSGNEVWSDGLYVYRSSNSTGTGHYVLDLETSTWSTKVWNGLTTLFAQNIWTDGTNIYYSAGTNDYVLDITTSTWTTKTWGGLSSLFGLYIWTDGNNIYYSNDTNHYVLNTKKINSKIDSSVNAKILGSHTYNTGNPHSVTKTQVGLGNVYNPTTYGGISYGGGAGESGISFTNLNSLAYSGFYTCYGTTANVPSASYSWFIQHINSNVGNASATQIATAYGTANIIYKRNKVDGTWGDWENISPSLKADLSGATFTGDVNVASGKTYKIDDVDVIGDKAKVDASNLTAENVESWQEKLGNSLLVADLTLETTASSITINDLDLMGDGGYYDIYMDAKTPGADIRMRVNNISSSIYKHSTEAYRNGTTTVTGSGNITDNAWNVGGVWTGINIKHIKLFQRKTTEVSYMFASYGNDPNTLYSSEGGGNVVTSATVSSIRFHTEQGNNFSVGTNIKIYKHSFNGL